MATNFLLSAVAVAAGLFAAISPARAARIWGWDHLDSLAPGKRTQYLYRYRVFGIVLCLAGICYAIDTMAFRRFRN
jgi:hypothetical protein